MKHIPNILSILRLLMIPAFMASYFIFDTGIENTCIAAGIYTLAWITDVLDGYLARRNNWITDAGKFLDPLADKLMQLAAAICFTLDNSIFLIMLIPLVIKETCMLIGFVFVVRKRNVVVGARWYGKLATAVLFVCAATRVIIRNSPLLDVCVATIVLIVMIFSLTMYYFNEFKGKYKIDVF